jgi:hypothetical protein
MAEQILQNCDILVGGYNWTTQHNQVTVNAGREAKDKSAFRGNTRIYKPGLKTVDYSTQFFYDADATNIQIDDEFWSNIDDSGVPLTVWPAGADEGNLGYGSVIAKSAYNLAGVHGELFTGTMNAGPAGELWHPTSLIDHLTARTSTADGSSVQVGAVSATQSVMAFLQVILVSGTSPTLDVTVESDDDTGFASAATRFTFVQKTAVGYEVMAAVNGAITDDWWRVSYTIGGSDTPTFKFLVGLYIGPQ